MTISQYCRLGLAAVFLTAGLAAQSHAKEAPKANKAKAAPATSKGKADSRLSGMTATPGGPVKATGGSGGTAVKTYKFEGAAVSDSGCGHCTVGTRDNCKPGDVGTTASPPSCQPGGTFCCYTISQ